MPWTLAHPAAVLPLRALSGRWLPFGALVTGSCTPDLGYYIGRMDLAAVAHTAPGLVLVCLPAGLLLFAVARFLHRPVASLLPEPHRRAVLSVTHLPRFASVASLAGLCLAVIAGAATHNAWDSLTHPGAFVVERVAALRAPAFALGSYPVPVYQLLQHTSTALGLAVLLIAYRRWIRTAAPAAASDSAANLRRYRLLGLLALASVLTGVTLALARASAAERASTRLLVFRSAVCSTTLFAAALCVAALVLYPRRRED